MSNGMSAAAYRFYDYHPAEDDFRSAVLHGLQQPLRRLNPRLLYDNRGRQLYNLICSTREHYQCRTELAILQQYTADLTRHLGTGCLLIELGYDNFRKTRELVLALAPQAHLALDVSRQQLRLTAHTLANEFRDLEIHAVCTDYMQSLQLPYHPAGLSRVAFIPGNTIAHCDAGQLRTFLGCVATVIGSSGSMLVGIDLDKDPEALAAAYNDSAGLTEEFNLNLLERINRELGGNFNTGHFHHSARHDPQQRCVELRLISDKDQLISVAGQKFHFSDGEPIHTADAYHHSIEDFTALARSAGLQPSQAWCDEENLFAVLALHPR
ncbi:MAG: L-histidine N(alpha)-methyltransferase [Gammaproteobacteria bacterium]|nr:L-histidine N(alpha)-methyltransferase [Gammaproteobacteria bacterium]